MRRVAVLALVILGCLPGAAATLTSTFDLGDEGWTAYNLSTLLTYPVTQVPTGGAGNSGYLSTEDAANGYHMFRAPASWVGDFWGGSLSFSLRFLDPSNPNRYPTKPANDPLVRVLGGGLELWYVGGNNPGLDWTSYVVSLGLPGSWRVRTGAVLTPASASDLQTATSNLSGLYILADWATGHFGSANCPGGCGHDITGLDDVMLVVPEPGTTALVGAGILLLLLRKRRA